MIVRVLCAGLVLTALLAATGCGCQTISRRCCPPVVVGSAPVVAPAPPCCNGPAGAVPAYSSPAIGFGR